MFRDRWPIVPWGYPLSDLRPQGGAVFQKWHGGSHVMAYHVHGIANDPAAMLGIRVCGTNTTAVIAESSAVTDALGGAPNFDLDTCDGD